MVYSLQLIAEINKENVWLDISKMRITCVQLIKGVNIKITPYK